MSARDVIATQRCKHATMEWIDPPCDRCRKETDNFFDTAALAGFAIVPKEPTAHMLVEGNLSLGKFVTASSVWSAMLAASTEETK